MMVLLAHAPELVDGNRGREILSIIFRGNFSFGEVAVAGFFILSGFLISKSWDSRPNLWIFLKKRILRIFPAFIVASFVCALIVGPLGAQSLSNYFVEFHFFKFLIGALTLSQPIIPAVFVGQPYAIVNGAMWTIPIEFSCYLAVLVVGLFIGFRRSFCLVVTASLLSLCAFRYFSHKFDWLDVIHPNLASYFAVGSCFYVFRDRISFVPKFAAAAFLTLLIGMFSFRAHQIAFAIVGSYLLFYLAYAKIALIESFGNLPDVSYGLYLYGWPIQKLIIWWFPNISPWLVFPISAFSATAAGWVSWHLIEKRFIKSKKIIGMPPSPSVSTHTSAASTSLIYDHSEVQVKRNISSSS